MKTMKNHKTIRDDMWKLFENVPEKEELDCIYTAEDICERCSQVLFISDEGFKCCSNKECGKIYKDIVDFGAEWRFYGAEDTNTTDPTRCGMPVNPLLVESSFGCKIICRQGSSYEMRKVRRYTEWQSMPYKEKSKYDDFQAINVLATNAGMPKIIIDDAIRYYNKISQVKTYRGVNRDGILASSIYISCSINEHPRTSKEIAEIFKLDNTSATRGCKNALSILNDIERDEEIKTVLHNTTPTSFINRFCSKLSINQELTTLCLFIANIVEKTKLIPENTPHSISAGIVYFVCQKCNLSITKKMITTISKISEVTINKCFKKLELQETKLIPPHLLKKYISSL
jgi:transcription initiation factor TFIIIB Brf1 subunit/transcription initiation factor TFIIB